MEKHIALFGGTFDPVHNGHLQIAQFVQNHLNFSQVIFIPNNTPPHRVQPLASTQQRLAMLNLALRDNPNFIINRAEIDRAGPSYMVDTLDLLSQEHPDSCPWLILGRDAFDNLPTWHNFDKLITICNFIVLNRAHPQANSKWSQWSEWSENYLKSCAITLDEFDILNNTYKYKPNGSVLLLNNSLIDVSGTQIRELIKTSNNPPMENNNTLKNKLQKFLPKQVVNYILDHELYI